MNPLLSIIIEVQALVERNNSINRPSESVSDPQTHTHLCCSLIISFVFFFSHTLELCVFIISHNFCMENRNELNWTNWICTALRCCALIDQRHDWDLTDFSLSHFLLITEVHFQNTEKKSNKEAIKTQKCVTRDRDVMLEDFQIH